MPKEAVLHRAWFRNEIQRGLRDADDPAVTRIPHRNVASGWRRKRAALAKLVADRA
jgi:hypothetical protein